MKGKTQNSIAPNKLVELIELQSPTKIVRLEKNLAGNQRTPDDDYCFLNWYTLREESGSKMVKWRT